MRRATMRPRVRRARRRRTPASQRMRTAASNDRRLRRCAAGEVGRSASGGDVDGIELDEGDDARWPALCSDDAGEGGDGGGDHEEQSGTGREVARLRGAVAEESQDTGQDEGDERSLPEEVEEVQPRAWAIF